MNPTPSALPANPSLRRWGLLLAALLIFAAPAFARSWKISRFDARYVVSDDGQLDVDEEIRAHFEGEFHGILREIPVEYPGPDGTAYRLYLTVIGVTGEDNQPLHYEKSTRSERVAGGVHHDFLVLKIYDEGADTERTIHIHYRAANAVRFFKDHDELYWNVTGNDWKVPIDEASAFVALPSAAAGQFKAQSFTGSYGSRADAATNTIDGASVSFDSKGVLPPRSGLTIDLYLPKGILKEPSALTQALRFLGGNPAIFLPLWSLAVMFALWWWKGRDPDPGISVAPMYEPPKDLTPAEAGTLLTDNIEARDITSTLIDLAVKGYLKIIEHEEGVLIFKHKDYTLRLMKPRAEWTGLAPHELEVLENIFFDPGMEETSLSSLRNRFYLVLPSIRREIMDQLTGKEMYTTDPESAKGLALAGVLAIALPFLWMQMSGRIHLENSPSVLVPTLLISALIVFLFGRKLSAKTVRGARAQVECLGFKEFMTRVEEDRLRRMPPDTFERFLPYAMAFGVEQHWAKAFQGIITEPPSWYVGPGFGPGMMWNPMLFTSSIGSFSSSAYQSFTAAPQASSSGSGFGSGGSFGGDGGFSGGGFGGGGGDAF